MITMRTMRPFLVISALCFAIYVILSLTAAKQYAVLVAIVSYVSFNLYSLLNLYLSYRQTFLTTAMEERDAKRAADEAREAAKHARLALTFGDTTSIDTMAIGGHAKQDSPLGVYVYLKNSGDRHAADIRIYIGIPPTASPAKFPPQPIAVYQDPHIIAPPVFPSVNYQHNVLYYELGDTVGFIDHPSNVYPNERTALGLLVIYQTEGKHRFDWIIDSSAGQFRSNAASALYINVVGTAPFHDALPADQATNARTTCRYCQSIAIFTWWTQRLNQDLDLLNSVYNREGPGYTQSGIQAQWYQRSGQPQRWVTCTPSYTEANAMKARFWTDGQWEQGFSKVTHAFNTGAFANEVWRFLVSDSS